MEEKRSFLNGTVYEILKWMAVIALPALAVFVKTVFPTWEIPYAEQISTTIMAVDALIGALICVSTVQYNNSGK